MRTRDWSRTALGRVEDWPEHLKAPVRLMLASPLPSFIWWGPELIHLHNDACARLLGRGRAFGRPAAEIRDDIWNAIGTEVYDALDGNTSATLQERRVVVSRNGRELELYCSFSLTPIRDEWGTAVGVLGVGCDATAAVLSRRRLAALTALPDIARADTLDRGCEWAAAALASDVRDVPFALIYVAEERGTVSLAGSAGSLPSGLPRTIGRNGHAAPWPLDAFDRNETVRRVEPLPPEFRAASPEADGAAVLPLRIGVGKEAYLVIGLARRRPFDEDYRAFLDTAASLVSSGLEAASRRDQAASSADDDARRDEFLAMLAHELRNPLAPIRSAAELLAYVDTNPLSLSHARAIIERQLAQLVRLVDDLLDVSRISRGALELKRAPLDLRSAVASAVESVRPLMDGAHHELSVHMPERPVTLNGDQARLSQVIANLLTNAAQYTNPGGHVALSLDTTGSEARLRVSDDGIGIDSQLLPHVFEMFTQGEQRIGEPRRGLGIGLTVARRLIELHGGRIDAFSSGRDRGAELVVTLPLSKHDGDVPRMKGESRQPDRRRILVADDNTDAASAMAEILAMLGHDVRTADDGLEAVEVAERFRPELILLDIGMPRLDGYEACRRIRQRAWGRDVPIYAVTGWGQPSDRRRTREAGFNAHLVKPVSINAINDLIAQFED